MNRTRKNYPAKFKSEVSLLALHDATVAELSSRYSVHPTVIHRWKKEDLASMENGFSGKLEAMD